MKQQKDRGKVEKGDWWKHFYKIMMTTKVTLVFLVVNSFELHLTVSNKSGLPLASNVHGPQRKWVPVTR